MTDFNPDHRYNKVFLYQGGDSYSYREEEGMIPVEVTAEKAAQLLSIPLHQVVSDQVELSCEGLNAALKEYTQVPGLAHDAVERLDFWSMYYRHILMTRD